MSENSAIEWCDHTFNPWEGCQNVGPGCDHCYAETRNARFAGGRAINWGPGAPRRRTSTGNWAKPVLWNKHAGAFMAAHGRRQRVFCASLADVFDNAVDSQWRFDLLRLIEQTPNLDWLLLTKRIGNAAAMLEQAIRAITHGREGWADNYFQNVWIGATIVNQDEAERDIPKLLAVPAVRRFLSMEPLLGAVDFYAVSSAWFRHGYAPWSNAPILYGIDWVIVGGESGPGARPMHPDWARNLRDQCIAAGVPFLFKQWGEWANPDDIEKFGKAHHGWWEDSPDDGGMPRHEWPVTPPGPDFPSMRPEVYRVGKKSAGRLLDGVQHDGFPEAL